MTGTWERCTIRLIFQWCTVIFDWYTWKVLCSFTQSLNPFLTFFFFQILLNSSKSDKCSCSVPFWRVIRPLERASAADNALPWIKLEIRSSNGSWRHILKPNGFVYLSLEVVLGEFWAKYGLRRNLHLP